MIYQQWDIFRAFPQGWNVNRKNIQAVKQIFAKFLLLNHLSEVAIGGCDQVGIGVNSPCASQPLEFSLLEHAQQLGLKLQRNVADLIQKYRSAIGQLKAADALRDSAGKSAFLVPEELAFEQACRNRRTVELNKGPPGPRTGGMNGSRYEFFARPRFAQNQHRRLRRCDNPHLL